MDLLFGGNKKKTQTRMRKFKASGVHDFFEKTPAMPKSAILLAPGPEGVPFYHLLPGNIHWVGVNKAALIPWNFKTNKTTIDTWVISDSTNRKKKWWRSADKKYAGRRIFSMTMAKHSRVYKQKGVPDRYVFDMASADYTGPYTGSGSGKIRKGGTVAAAALWVMYYCGVKIVYLLGVDMSGNIYMDGQPNEDAHYAGKHGDVWVSAQACDRVIRWLQLRGGMKIYTLSPTKLKVPTPITIEEAFSDLV